MDSVISELVVATVTVFLHPRCIVPCIWSLAEVPHEFSGATLPLSSMQTTVTATKFTQPEKQIRDTFAAKLIELQTDSPGTYKIIFRRKKP